jgi:hypothetical protein
MQRLFFYKLTSPHSFFSLSTNLLHIFLIFAKYVSFYTIKCNHCSYLRRRSIVIYKDNKRCASTESNSNPYIKH